MGIDAVSRGLILSIADEQKAQADYKERMAMANAAGLNEVVNRYAEIIRDEADHEKQFKDLLDLVTALQNPKPAATFEELMENLAVKYNIPKTRVERILAAYQISNLRDAADRDADKIVRYDIKGRA